MQISTFSQKDDTMISCQANLNSNTSGIALALQFYTAGNLRCEAECIANRTTESSEERTTMRLIFIIVSLLIMTCTQFAFAQTFQPGGHLLLRDSGGTLIGQVVGNGVSVVANGHNVILTPTPSGLVGNIGTISFDQPNCQGTPFIDRAAALFSVSWPTEIIPDGTFRIASSLQGTTRTMTSDYNVALKQCSNFTRIITALPTELGPNLNAQFTTPFMVAPGVIPTAPVAVPLTNRVVMFLLVLTLACFGVTVLRR